jgi:hypothetical protein
VGENAEMDLASVANKQNIDEYKKELLHEVERSRNQLDYNFNPIEHVRIVLNKFIDRNTTIPGHLQQINSRIDPVPCMNIQAAFNAAMDIQQHIMVMCEQVENKQFEQDFFKTYDAFLNKIN